LSAEGAATPSLIAMARRKAVRTTARGARRKSTRRFRAAQLLPDERTRRRWYKRFSRAPTWLQVVLGVVIVALVWLPLNWTYQVIRKPSELFFPVSDSLYKTPTETWDEYAGIFHRHSTNVMTADFLAALAQVEGSGNPVARTYWRWSLTHRPFDVYRPASSAVGMYQFTDGTFEEARHYCIRHHVVAKDDACWFNVLYTRTIPSHAVEMTSAYLDTRVSETLSRYGIQRASLQQKQDLATLIHLCGAGAGNIYVRRGLQLSPGQQCGDHDARGYLLKVQSMRRIFARLDAGDND
jgi:hypothetical protein